HKPGSQADLPALVLRIHEFMQITLARDHARFTECLWHRNTIKRDEEPAGLYPCLPGRTARKHFPDHHLPVEKREPVAKALVSTGLHLAHPLRWNRLQMRHAKLRKHRVQHAIQRVPVRTVDRGLAI